MGVFDRFFRRKDAVVAEEAVTVPPAAESGPACEAGAGPAEAKVPAAEAVEIPKQQSAEVAADSETGESARS